MEHSDSRDKTHSMIEKITFFCSIERSLQEIDVSELKMWGVSGLWEK